MLKILIVEDGKNLHAVLGKYLTKDYVIDRSTNAIDAKSLLEQKPFDIVVIDLELPNELGFQLSLHMKSQDVLRDIPILFISGNPSHDPKVTGLNLGSDDFFGKPFNKTVFYKKTNALSHSASDPAPRSTRKKPFTFDVKFQRAFLNEGGKIRDLKLTSSEFKLLLSLLERSNQLVTREDLRSQSFRNEREVTSHCVDAHISNLRKKMGTSHNLIRAVRGLGYMIQI